MKKTAYTNKNIIFVIIFILVLALAAVFLIIAHSKPANNKSDVTEATTLMSAANPDATTASETAAETSSTEDETTTAQPETTTAEPETTTAVPETTAQPETPSISNAEAERDAHYSLLVAEAVAAGRKVVYLTFDDGSGTLTPTVLDILDQYGVKATFFVVGNYSPSEDFARTEYNDIINRGHTLGIHSFTHSRANIYASFEAFKADADRMYNYVINLTGQAPAFWRFPGGSATSFADSRMKTDYIPYIESLGLTYYDWNVSSGDGSGNITRDQVYQNVINGVAGKSVSVVLMHDGSGHEETVAALPSMLNTLINEMNCLVVPITASTTPIQSQF